MIEVALAFTLIRGDYPDSPTRDWYRSLKQPNSSVSCCDVSDCGPVEARTNNGQWQVEIDGRWVDVPPGKLVKRENPTGRGQACYVKIDSTVMWYCFVPPPLA